MKKRLAWVFIALYYVVSGAFLLAIYSRVIHTPFESVIFSVLVLIYLNVKRCTGNLKSASTRSPEERRSPTPKSTKIQTDPLPGRSALLTLPPTQSRFR